MVYWLPEVCLFLKITHDLSVLCPIVFVPFLLYSAGFLQGGCFLFDNVKIGVLSIDGLADYHFSNMVIYNVPVFLDVFDNRVSVEGNVQARIFELVANMQHNHLSSCIFH